MISSLKRPGRGWARTTASRSASVNFGKSDAEHVHLDAGGNERDDGMHVRWDAGRSVQRDGGPDRLDLALGYAMAAEEVTGSIGAVHLEALMRARVLWGEAHVMEHGAGVKQLGIET